MNKKNKLLQKFCAAPQSLSLNKIEPLLATLGLIKIQGKGSHTIYKYQNETILVIPVHNQDCKNFYKKKLLKELTKRSIL
jgi:predicted RNA binding protein YcfA (HicA-like mRNA interferase family)